MQYTVGHWGIGIVERGGAEPLVKPWAQDPDAPALGTDQLSDTVAAMRIRGPSIRRGWLDGGPGHLADLRGREPFVEVSWDEAFRLLGGELRRVIDTYGNEAIYGGSYGWASAGRFHHAQSQMHRFLNCIGGYVRHLDSYSHGAATVVMPHIVGSLERLFEEHTDWDVMAAHTELFVAFGGVPTKNSHVTAGGVSRHRLREGLEAMRARGTRFVNVSPQRSDFDTFPVEWIPIRPNTDTAMMLGMACTLVQEGRHDQSFLNRCCVGGDRFLDYLTGTTDGVVKDADWAQAITGVPAERIRTLARDAAQSRTMLNASWSLQRADHGEQPYWAVVSLAALLGQLGLPGGGFAVGYGTMNSVGSSRRRLKGPTFPQGRNPVSAAIPVARLADMLLQPGESYAYNGREHVYPDIKLIYWAGGNPFHHHQDLHRLIEAWKRPETIVVQDQFWTASARSADIVLPATTTLERDDIGYAAREGFLVPMKKMRDPIGTSRHDFAIFAGLSAVMGVEDAFTEGLDEPGWLRRIYEECRTRAVAEELTLPSFDDFWAGGVVDLGPASEPIVMMQAFRADPERAPLQTPSGRIELFSSRVAGFGLRDCPGHAAWIEPVEWLGAEGPYGLHLLTNQPSHRLHSQLDHGPHSRSSKVRGREVLAMNPIDAEPRGIRSGDLVRLYNARGACLAAARVTEDVMPRVLSMPTGAWFDPQDWSPDNTLERHGNPNVLTRDAGTSSLAQGCAAQSCMVEVELWTEDTPIGAFEPPIIVAAGRHRGSSSHSPTPGP